jgi:pyridoxine 5-phosphate synthase
VAALATHWQELTTEGGLDLVGKYELLKQTVSRLQQEGIPVSLFIDPEPEALRVSKELGVHAVELQTGSYAEAENSEEVQREIQRIQQSARAGLELRLKVFAGHGLHYMNLSPLVKIKEIEEYNIGHSIIARSLFVGLAEAVREMKALLQT